MWVGGIRMSTTDRVGAVAGDLAQQRVRILHVRHDLHARLRQEVDDALPGQQHVLRDDHAHGSSTVSRVPAAGSLVTADRPPAAPTRSSTRSQGPGATRPVRRRLELQPVVRRWARTARPVAPPAVARRSASVTAR